MRSRAWIGVVLLAAAAPARAAWHPDRFLVGGYCTNGTSAEHASELQDMNDAGLDFVINFNLATPASANELRRVLDALAGRSPDFHLRMIAVSLGGSGRASPTFREDAASWEPLDRPAADSPAITSTLDGLAGPSLLGVQLQDEPRSPDSIDTIRVAVDRIQSTRSELAFVNLLAAGLGRRGATLWNPSDIADWQAAYRNYVGRYVAPHGANAIRPPVVSVDAYPFIFPHPAWGGDRPNVAFFATLKLLRDVATRENGVPFCYVMQIGRDAAPFYPANPAGLETAGAGGHCGPIPDQDRVQVLYALPLTERKLRFQAFAGLAYGAKAIAYFPLTPAFDEFEGGLLYGSGKRTPAYDLIRRLTAEIHHLGRWLLPLTPDRAYHVSLDPVPGSPSHRGAQVGIDGELVFDGSLTALGSQTPGGADWAMASRLRDPATGYDYLFLMNKNTGADAFPIRITATLGRTPSAVFHVSKATGDLEPMGTASARVESGLIAPGDAELYQLRY